MACLRDSVQGVNIPKDTCLECTVNTVGLPYVVGDTDAGVISRWMVERQPGIVARIFVDQRIT